jgi:hypothetical protein
VAVKVEPPGKPSLTDTSVLEGTPAGLLSESSSALMTALVVLPWQVPLEQAEGAPPDAKAVLVTLKLLWLDAVAERVMGTVMTTVPLTPPGMVQPLRLLEPGPGQPRMLVLALMVPLVVMPVGRVSLTLMACVVGPLLMPMDIW